jgi:hypothetical protein
MGLFLFINFLNVLKMKNIRNDYCIRMFLGFDSMRPALTKVNLHDEFLYATDAYAVAKIKADLCVHKYAPVEGYPDAHSVIGSHDSAETKTVSVDTLFNDLMHIEACFRPKMIQCDECDGDGTCVCDHCDSEYECKECKGTGRVPGSKMELSGEHNCTIHGKTYRLKYIDRIIRTAVYTGVKEIQISNSHSAFAGTLFTVGDFTIVLMPVYNPE